ncbi:GNAT family N-acetyltransferase [Phaeobacter sp. QD34_3]|uniref:GNAT family N-acetyltransferase n=1 Tax=unclassified Phaeobacter TaxID=2621772 RepID=UPI00237F5B52|nr:MULTISPECIES: GNAT family N-acetyltransferase [unclassified Phaeobacter]MDE4132735.1 GNAT family N-acetyltransferase [Phaeobacter sp. QD34_3]MDE4136472.1 GNAT family N-acetyltransferase [Phaeobacter sp. QD34_24]
MTQMQTLTLRPARSTDAGGMGEILHRFEMETAWMPKQHSGAEAIGFCGVMIDRGWVTVVEGDGAILGFLARDGDEICSLYVTPEARGGGIGKRLLDAAKIAVCKGGNDGTADTDDRDERNDRVGEADPARLSLRTFQANEGAQRFYLREGFAEVGRSDGAQNDEGLPDIEYVWPASPNPKERAG